MSKKDKQKNGKKKSAHESPDTPKSTLNGVAAVLSETRISVDAKPIEKSIKVDKGIYSKELPRLQVELVKL